MGRGRLGREQRGGGEEGEMGRGRQGGRQWGGGDREGGSGEGAKAMGRRRGKRRLDFTDGYVECLDGHRVRVDQWLQADRMPWVTKAMEFTDSYKHMECLGGMTLQFFLVNGHFVYPCNARYPS